MSSANPERENLPGADQASAPSNCSAHKGYRLLRVGEMMQVGDQMADDFGWMAIRVSMCGHRRLRDDPMIRRVRKRRAERRGSAAARITMKTQKRKRRTTKRTSRPLQPLVSLRRIFKHEARYYRGNNFALNHDIARERRDAKADAFDWAADVVGNMLRKSKQANND